MKEQKEIISFDQVMALDIRICKVLSAERIPKKDKLIKLTIDTGIDTRTSVTNLGEKYEIGDFVGHKFPFILNLAPAKIGGIETSAMIMVVGLENGLVEFHHSVSPIGSVLL